LIFTVYVRTSTINALHHCSNYKTIKGLDLSITTRLGLSHTKIGIFYPIFFQFSYPIQLFSGQPQCPIQHIETHITFVIFTHIQHVETSPNNFKTIPHPSIFNRLAIMPQKHDAIIPIIMHCN